MTCIKAVIFDYIGTLVNCKGYAMDASMENLYAAVVYEGFKVSKDRFLAAYAESHEKYRKIRYEELREVTNSVWVAEALRNLGFNVTEADYRIKCALNVFFKAYIDSFELRDGVKKLLKQIQNQSKIGLISNFTHSPVIYSSLRYLGIDAFFNAVVVSEETGWRKPSPKIFQEALNRLQIKAEEGVYIGDSPNEDIKGAKAAGLKTVFIPSQFNTTDDLLESQQKPDYTAKDVQSIIDNIVEITTNKS
ncbi:MAG TPA: HAD family hydrolase [Candidatus Acidoferrum sp.]|nr:HAD family hydrolase [Candidatus Acidoferrum sp.]